MADKTWEAGGMMAWPGIDESISSIMTVRMKARIPWGLGGYLEDGIPVDGSVVNNHG